MAPVIRSFGEHSPRLAPSVYLADTAVVTGDVEIGEDSSIWFGAVLRGDVGFIRIGARTNIQDLCMVHMSRSLSNTEIGDDVTVGHSVIIHGARIHSGALIGMGSILLDNVVVGEEALVAAGSLLTSGLQVPPRTLVRGRPGRVVRELTAEEAAEGRKLAARYVEVGRTYAAQPPRP
jgi:carbonic anhydrase/acetyltransferase-like protein (isoleucine patch superfamily)